MSRQSKVLTEEEKTLLFDLYRTGEVNFRHLANTFKVSQLIARQIAHDEGYHPELLKTPIKPLS